MTEHIRVVVVDDHHVVRQGLRTYLESFSDLEVVGESSSGEEALRHIELWLPDVVVMDLLMPGGMDGVETIRRMRQVTPRTQTIALTSYTDDARVIAVLRAGAVGYVRKDAAPDVLLASIRAAAHGQSLFDPAVAGAVVQELSKPDVALSEREQEVLRQVAWAKTFGLPLELITPTQARELFPLIVLEGVRCASYLPTDGYLDPSRLTYALIEGARAGGVLRGLGHDGAVGGHDQQVEVDAGGAGDHRAHEALVARYVDDRQGAARRQIEPCVAELDRDPARLLLGEAVGVDPGQRADQRRFAVVYVAGSPERQRAVHREPSARLTSSASASVSVRGSSSSSPSWARPTSGGSPSRSGTAHSTGTATTGPSSSSSGSAPPPTLAVLLMTLARGATAIRAARPASSASVAPSIASTGISRRARSGSR